MRQPPRPHVGCLPDSAPSLSRDASSSGPSESTSSRADSDPAESKLPYAAGLDGLRAVAVIAVLLYHARDIAGLPAVLRPSSGFLGVEVFFVISGYLITALLLAEHVRGRGIGLIAFWQRRARRLLPALYLLLLGALVATVVVGDPFEAIRRELAAALLYVSNWLLIAQDGSYFDSVGRPSLLRHLWSLAVEEQFYLLWPPVLLVGLRWFGLRTLFALTVAAAMASTAIAWRLFDGLDQYGDVTAIYYRTDARAAGLLLGAAAAIAWRPWLAEPSAAVRGRYVRWPLELVAVAALVAVVGVQYRFTDQLIDWDAQRQLYHAGFLFTSVPSVLLIGAVVMPGSRVGAALGNPLLRWVGTRSYALYLWHWPVYQLTRPRIDVPLDGWSSLAVRLAVTVILAELSYRLVERPVRERRMIEVLRGLWPSRRTALRTAVNLGALAIVAALAAPAAAIDRGDLSLPGPRAVFAEANPARPPFVANPPLVIWDASEIDAALAGPRLSPVRNRDVTALPGSVWVPPPREATASVAQATPTVSPSATPQPTELAPAPRQDPVIEPASTPVPLPPGAPLPTTPSEPLAATMTVVGDSVVLGAATELAKIGDGVAVHGQVGRQWWEITSALETLADGEQLGDIVVIQLGNNGTLTDAVFDAAMVTLADLETVLFVNVRVPRPWEGEVNAMIAAGVARHAPRARLVDWHAFSNDHPEYFLPDGVHLQPAGSAALRSLIEGALSG